MDPEIITEDNLKRFISKQDPLWLRMIKKHAKHDTVILAVALHVACKVYNSYSKRYGSRISLVGIGEMVKLIRDIKIDNDGKLRFPL